MRAIAIVCFMVSGFCISIGIDLLPEVFERVAQAAADGDKFALLVGGLMGAFLFPLTFFLLGIGALSRTDKKSEVATDSNESFAS